MNEVRKGGEKKGMKQSVTISHLRLCSRHAHALNGSLHRLASQPVSLLAEESAFTVFFRRRGWGGIDVGLGCGRLGLGRFYIEM